MASAGRALVLPQRKRRRTEEAGAAASAHSAKQQAGAAACGPDAPPAASGPEPAVVPAAAGADRYKTAGKCECNDLIVKVLERVSFSRFHLEDARALILDGPALRTTSAARKAGLCGRNITVVNDWALNPAEHREVQRAVEKLGVAAPKLVSQPLREYLRKGSVLPQHLLFLDYCGFRDREVDVAAVFERGWYAPEGFVLAVTGPTAHEPLTLDGSSSLGTKGLTRHAQHLNELAQRLCLEGGRLRFLSPTDGSVLPDAAGGIEKVYRGASGQSHMWLAVHVGEVGPLGAPLPPLPALLRDRAEAQPTGPRGAKRRVKCRDEDADDRRAELELEAALRKRRVPAAWSQAGPRAGLAELMEAEQGPEDLLAGLDRCDEPGKPAQGPSREARREAARLREAKRQEERERGTREQLLRVLSAVPGAGKSLAAGGA